MDIINKVRDLKKRTQELVEMTAQYKVNYPERNQESLVYLMQIQSLYVQLDKDSSALKKEVEELSLVLSSVLGKQ